MRRRDFVVGALGAGMTLAFTGSAVASRRVTGADLESVNPESNCEALRVVSIGGGVSETIAALGGLSCLVGVDTTSTFPEALTRLPQVGYQHALPVEGVLSLRPHAVVHDGSAGPSETLSRLQQAGIENWILDGEPSWDGLARRITTLGDRLNRVVDSQRLLAEIYEARSAITLPPAPGPNVLFVMSHGAGSAVAAGRETKADALLSLAGCRNALAGQRGYRPISTEGVLRLRPDAVVLAGDPSGDFGRGLSRTLRSLPVLTEETLFLLGFGPRLPEAVGRVAGFMRDSLPEGLS
ncbi:MAG: hemin ABC transporter substrate-binding protein [Thioalkalivibrionaceae bacterium]